MGQRISTDPKQHHYLQEKLQESKLGHLILLPHFLKKLQTQLTFMGQRLTCFSRKLPNPFSLTPVNIIILKKNCKSHLRSSIIHVSTSH